MKPNKLIMYIVEDMIIIWSKDKVYKEKIQKGIAFGKIFKQIEFIKNMQRIIKKQKLNSGMLNSNITVIHEPYYTPVDVDILKSCLENLSFNKIDFINITKLYKLKRNNVYITANLKYMFITYINYKQKVESIYVDYKLFLNDHKLLAKHLQTIMKKKKIIVVGHLPNLENLANYIELYTGNKTFYIDDPDKFILKGYKNTLCK